MGKVLLLLGLLGVGAACAEATDGVDPNELAWPADEAAAGESPGAAGQDGGKKPVVRSDAATGSVRISEISGSGEWIELLNEGTAAAVLSGLKIADRDKDTGGPKLEDAVTFAVGAILAPGAFAIVRGGGADAGKPCPGSPSVCVAAEFGISSKNGETIFLLDEADAVVEAVEFPPSEGVPATQTWCKKGEAFAACTETPAAKN